MAEVPKVCEIEIIALTGKKQSGKSTLADLIDEASYCGTSIESFASPLKSAACAIFGFTKDQVEDPVQKERLDER